MGKPRTKEEIIAHKNAAITNFSSFLDTLIESPTDNKRAVLISYWLNDFQTFLSQEKTFDSSKIKSYKRGDVIKVNLGFNVGSEQGGLRYAIVLDKNNKHNSKTLTIVPLASLKDERRVNERDIALGRELYNRLKSKYDSTLESLTEKRIEYEENVESTNAILKSLKTFQYDDSPSKDALDYIIQHTEEMLATQQEALRLLDDESKNLKKIESELQKMKDGSIAKIEQITTISKQRIYDPKRSSDVLSGIRFSDTAMDKINEKIKELYIF